VPACWRNGSAEHCRGFRRDDRSRAEGKHVDTAPVDAKAIPATGKINSVDAAKGSVNVTHDPIKALGWPKMKMEFSVAKGVDLSSVKAGDAVNFSLKAEGEDNYVITKINKAK
jgi:Cu/Ag efflux protein CusF